MAYRVRAVDTDDDLVADDLVVLHKLTFADTAPLPDFAEGHWWLCYHGSDAVAFIGMIPSTRYPGSGYFERFGVANDHRGHRLGIRLIKAMERRARGLGYRSIVTDTTDNPQSANTLIRAGYRVFRPEYPWSFPIATYWRKDL